MKEFLELREVSGKEIRIRKSDVVSYEEWQYYSPEPYWCQWSPPEPILWDTQQAPTNAYYVFWDTTTSEYTLTSHTISTTSVNNGTDDVTHWTYYNTKPSYNATKIKVLDTDGDYSFIFVANTVYNIDEQINEE